VHLPDRLAAELATECRNRAAVQIVLALAMYDTDPEQPINRTRLKEITGIAEQSLSLGLEYALGRDWLCFDTAPKRKNRAYHINWKLYLLEKTSDKKTLIIRENVRLEETPKTLTIRENPTLSDAKTLIVRENEAGTPDATRAGDSSRKPLKTSPKKTETSTKSVAKRRHGASAAAASPPDRSPEDDKLEQFEAWLSEQEPGYRELFEYAAPALGAPCKTTSARKRAEAASAVRAIYRDGCTLEDFKAVRREYDRDPWRDRQTGRKIPLSPKILRERYADLLARARDPDEGDEPQAGGAEVIELPKRGNGNGQHAKTFNEQRDEYEAAKLRAIDGAIEDALAGRDEPAAPGGRHGDLEEGPPGGRPRLAGPRDASDPRRHLG
jgi:hypothetical protein